MVDDPNDENMQALLRSIEADTMRTSSSRDRIRDSVLASFDDATIASTGDESEVITLVPLDDASRRSIWSRRAAGWSAAAAAALVAAVMLLPDDDTRVETAATPTSAVLSLDGIDLPAPLPSGLQITDLIAGGMSFDAPDGFVIVEASDGLLILALAEESNGSGQLIFVEVEPSDWEGRLRELAAAGEVNLKEIGMMVSGRATTRLDVTITNETLAERSCVAGEPCMSIDGGPVVGPVALWAGSDNRVVELGRTEDSMVLTIEISQQFQGPLSRLAAEIISTASLSSD